MPGQQQRTFNTDDGRFEIRGLKAGEYTVQASTPDGLIAVQSDVVRVMDGRPSSEARLDLQTGAVLRGVVRDDETGRPIANAWIYASARPADGTQGVGATSGNAQSDAKGKYEIRGLGAGSYTVSVWTRGGASFSEVVDLQPQAERTLDLVRRRPGSLRITVVDEKGAPIAGARPHVQSSSGSYVSVNVTAMRKDGLIGEGFDWRALWNTDESGTLIRYHVPPGEVSVWATMRGYVMVGERPVVGIRSGRESSVQITMKGTAKDGG
jgi:protocatechuate 3,4-dioxygenase beta subunit